MPVLVVGIILIGLALMGTNPIKQRRLDEIQRIEDEKQAQIDEKNRLDSLSKCPSCQEPLDYVNNTFSRIQKEENIINIKVLHKEFEFYDFIGDIERINTITCKHCQNSFDEDAEVEENGYKVTKVKCPNCESFETNYSISQLGNTTSFEVICNCSDCGHNWYATEFQEELQQRKEKEIKRAKKHKQRKREKELQRLEEQKQQVIQQETPKSKASSSKVIGHKIRFILIYEKGPQQDMTEELPGVYGQAAARKVIEAKYKTNSVKRISWVNDFNLMD